jgi:hypothetical protein
MTTMDRSRRTESGGQPAITLVQPPDGMGVQPRGRCGKIVLSRFLHWFGRDRRAILATAWPPVDQPVERGRSRNSTTPGQIAANAGPPAYPGLRRRHLLQV